MYLKNHHALFALLAPLCRMGRLLLLLCLLPAIAWPANTLDVSLAKNNLVLTPKHGGNGSAWGQPRCIACHVLNTIHKQAPAPIKDIVKSKGYPSCAGCHGDNGTPTPRACLICHNAKDLPLSPEVVGIKKHDFDTKQVLDLKDKDCLACHNASDMDGQFENNVDLSVMPDKKGVKSALPSQTEFCLRCHNRDHQQPDFRIKNTDPTKALSASEDYFLNIDVHGARKGLGISTYSGLRKGYAYGTRVECSDCHAMHGSHNDDLIIGNSATGVFKINEKDRQKRFKATVSVDDDSQLCVFCHVMKNPVGMAKKDTGNGLSGVHLTGAGNDCRDCHTHGKNEKDLEVTTINVGRPKQHRVASSTPPTASPKTVKALGTQATVASVPASPVLSGQTAVPSEARAGAVASATLPKLPKAVAPSNLILTKTHGKKGNGKAWGIAQCDNCHPVTLIHRNAKNIKDIAAQKGYGACVGCHGGNGTGVARQCVVCHNKNDLPRAPEVVGVKKHDFDAKKVVDLKDKDCVACHYASDMDGNFNNNIDLTIIPDKKGIKSALPSQTEFCLRCHNRTHQQPGFKIKNTDPKNTLSAAEDYFLNADVHGARKGLGISTYTGLRKGYEYGTSVECSDCHAMHGTHNDKLIIGNSATGIFKISDAFRQKRYKASVRVDDDSQLCVFCHVMKNPVGMALKNTGNGLFGVHLTGAGSDCRDCHAHGKNEKDLDVTTINVGRPKTTGALLPAPKALQVSSSNLKANLILTKTHGKNGNGAAWGVGQCDSCHALSAIHRNAPDIKDIVLKKGYATCMGCHGTNGTVAGANVTSLASAAGVVDANATRKCVICHNVFDLPKAPDLNAAKNHNFKASSEQPLTDAMCMQCHDASDMNGHFDANTDLTHFPNKAGRKVDYNNSAEFCLSCHNLDHQQPGALMRGYSPRHPLVAMETNWNFLDVHGKRKGSGARTYAGLRANVYQYGTQVECVDCHAMHGTHNNKLIIDSTAKGVFKFPDFARNLSISIDTPQGDYGQLCVTCHAMENIVDQGAQNTGNGLAGVHQVGGDCRDCHTHGMAAQTGL